MKDKRTDPTPPKPPKGPHPMARTLGAWWSRLSDVWKATTVLLAVGAAAAALTLNLLEYRQLPETVDALASKHVQEIDQVISTLNSIAGEVRELERRGADRDLRLDRIICLLEANQGARNLLECSR